MSSNLVSRSTKIIYMNWNILSSQRITEEHVSSLQNKGYKIIDVISCENNISKIVLIKEEYNSNNPYR